MHKVNCRRKCESATHSKLSTTIKQSDRRFRTKKCIK